MDANSVGVMPGRQRCKKVGRVIKPGRIDRYYRINRGDDFVFVFARYRNERCDRPCSWAFEFRECSRRSVKAVEKLRRPARWFSNLRAGAEGDRRNSATRRVV